MAATIDTAPERRNQSLDPIWLTLETSLFVADPAYFELVASGFNVAGETLALTWGGTTLEFELATTPDSSGLQLPTYTTGTDVTYHQLLAEYFRRNEILTDDFTVEYTTSNSVKLTYRHGGAIVLSDVNGITNMSVADNDSLGNITAENSRGLVQVFADTGDVNTDTPLAKFHSPYDQSTGLAGFDLSPAFAHLKPHLPDATSIMDWESGLASDALQKWFFRYADKYGTPAVAETMLKYATSYLTFYGASAGDALASATNSGRWADENLRHSYIIRGGSGLANGLSFWKPIDAHQPDWVYAFNGSAGNREVRVHYWLQDGSEGDLTTLGPVALAADSLYWFGAGPDQIGLDVWSDPDNPCVRYTWGLYITGTSFKITTVQYEILPDCQDWGFYLLYDNGLGGCETIWLKGKFVEGYDASADLVQRIRTSAFTPALGEFDKIGQQGQQTFEASTGYFDSEDYLILLRQIPLSTYAWIVDTENERFLKVNVDAKRIDTVKGDDQDLFSLSFTLRAAWLDMASNL